MCKSINKLSEDLNELMKNGYSLEKIQNDFYNKIGENILFHKDCDQRNCKFWLIIFEIENIYKILKNSEKCLELDDSLKESLGSIIGKACWETRWDHIY
jgi:hypothetical protein